MKNRITRPKYPLLLENGSRNFFRMLVQLGNEIMSKCIPYEQIGEIQIYPYAGCWWYRVFENPNY